MLLILSTVVHEPRSQTFWAEQRQDEKKMQPTKTRHMLSRVNLHGLSGMKQNNP